MDKTFHSIALAGAGTGKTYSLVENYICALFGLDESGIKKRPSELLALTFTQKAANEMRVRIAERLTRLQQEGSKSKDPLYALAQERALQLPNSDEIKRILRALPHALISTFHGFCSQLLREDALKLSMSDNFELLSPGNEKELARNILRPLILNRINNDKKQWQSLVARFKIGNNLQSDGLIDAILRLYFSLFEKGISFHDINNEIRVDVDGAEKLRRSVDEIDQCLAFFRSLPCTPKTAERIVDIAKCYERFVDELVRLDEQHVSQAWHNLRASVGGNFGERTARKNLVDAIASVGSRLVDYFVKEDEIALCGLLVEFHEEFCQFKKANAWLSFSDLLLKMREALANDPSFRQHVKRKFNHILVDEYQDTSPLQEDLIALIAENKDVERILPQNARPISAVDFTNGASLFVVGDKKQSIYGFRGADVGLFDDMTEKMASTSAAKNKFNKRLLTINRRSQCKVLSLINLVSQHTLGPQGYELAEDLAPLHDDGRGTCAVWVASLQDDNEEERTKSNLDTAVFGIGRLLRSRTDLRACDIVVLVRRIKSALPLKKGLKALGIPSRIVGGEGFYQQLEIVEILSALKLINHPGHQMASATVFRSPLVLLSDTEILRLARNSDGKIELSLLSAMKHENFSADGGERFARFVDCLGQIRIGIVQNGLAWAIDRLIDTCDYAYALGIKHNADQAFANIRKLKEIILTKKGNPFCLIDELFAEVDGNSSEPQAHCNEAQDQVTIMTIHQSKGLEFKVVVLADGEGRLPNNSSAFLFSKGIGMGVSPKGRPVAVCVPVNAEERQGHPTKFDRIRLIQAESEQQEVARLLYVALTRAKEELYIASSKEGFCDGGKSKTLLGLFLRAYEQDPTAFLQYCALETIEPVQPVFAEEKQAELDSKPVTFSPSVFFKRRSSSTLKCVDTRGFGPIIRKDFSEIQRGINGDLAHKLLASIGPVLTKNKEVKSAELERMLRACLRAEAFADVDERMEKTLAAVGQTARLLAAHLCSAQRIIFEMPLSALVSNEVTVEGFADLVAQFETHVEVWEFKSSLTAATHPNTYLQLFAYAHALAARFHKPIKLGVILIGAEQELLPRSYDALCQELLAASVRPEVTS